MQNMARVAFFVGSVVVTLCVYNPMAKATPSRLWGTYDGGDSIDFAKDASFDSIVQLVVVGVAYSSAGIATMGAHDVSVNNEDAFVTQFDEFGTLQWGTYYGGAGSDIFEHVVTNSDDEIYAFGRTNSTTDIATNGGSLSGAYDTMLVKFDTSGTRLWGLYYGGSNAEVAGGNCIDHSSGSVYIVGQTASTTQIATVGAHDTSLNSGGAGDAFLAKFSSSGTLQWGTYYGGDAPTRGYACSVDSSGNVFVTGQTNATMGIASGGFDNSANGSMDSFLVKFNSSGSRQWGTYYGGADGDFAFAVGVDSSGDVYIAGATESTSGIATSGAFGGGGLDAYVAKFNTSGARQWGRYFGGSGGDQFLDMEINGTALTLSGTTGSPAGINSGGFDTTLAAGGDAMFVTMNSSGTQTYGSYNGGTLAEEGYGVARTTCDAAVVGMTTSSTGIATTGAHDTSQNSQEDIFVTYVRLCDL